MLARFGDKQLCTTHHVVGFSLPSQEELNSHRGPIPRSWPARLTVMLAQVGGMIIICFIGGHSPSPSDAAGLRHGINCHRLACRLRSGACVRNWVNRPDQGRVSPG